MRVGELLATYLSSHLRFLPSYQTTLRLARVTFPPLGFYEVEALTPCVVLTWRASLAHCPAQANKALGLLGTIYRWGRAMQLHACASPTDGIRRLPEYPRARVVSAQEWHRLLPVLDAAHPKSRAYFFTVILCGPRLSEPRLMRWQDVDLQLGLWRKPAWTTKARRPHTIPLPSQVVAWLAGLPRLGDWVFPGWRWDRPWAVSSIEKAWGRLRLAASLPDVTIHHLRHSCATELDEAGVSLRSIQQVLGHASLQVTQRYVHPSLGTVRAGLQARADGLLSAYTTKSSASRTKGGPHAEHPCAHVRDRESSWLWGPGRDALDPQ